MAHVLKSASNRESAFLVQFFKLDALTVISFFPQISRLFIFGIVFFFIGIYSEYTITSPPFGHYVIQAHWMNRKKHSTVATLNELYANMQHLLKVVWLKHFTVYIQYLIRLYSTCHCSRHEMCLARFFSVLLAHEPLI